VGVWLFCRRVRTGKAFYRPMNHVVHAHLKSIMSVEIPSRSVGGFTPRHHAHHAPLAVRRAWTMLGSRENRSQKTARKRRRIPAVQCTLCWAVAVVRASQSAIE